EEWGKKLESIKQESEHKLALLEKERQLASLQSYTQRRINEERDNIAPELIDLITGNTEDEVEASITMMKAKTDAIFTNLQDAQTQVAAGMRGVSTSGYSATDGPLENQSVQKTYSVDELKSMPMSEYVKYRDKLHGAASIQNQGMF